MKKAPTEVSAFFMVTPKTVLSNLVRLGQGLETMMLGWNREVAAMLGRDIVVPAFAVTY